MKRLKLSILLLCMSCVICAQVSTQNYIRTRTMLNGAYSAYIDDIAYYDGLGRPFQTVQKTVWDTDKTDNILATLQEYDVAGREANAWLPIAVSSDYMAPASFKKSTSGDYGNDSHPYKEPVYEASPLGRIVRQYGPGAAWSTHPVRMEYLANTKVAPLNCTNYNVDNSYNLSKGADYDANRLQVIKITDEDGNAGYTFKDKQGHTLLIRQMKGSEAHDTYYVYDDYGNLSFALPPAMNGDISAANVALYAYQYKYDARHRCIWKKLPGVDALQYVYDQADRLIFSQDGRQRLSGKWMFYLYDSLGRLKKQGECLNKNTSSADAVVHVENFYDTYDFLTLTGFMDRSRFPAATTSAKGYLTGSVVTVLDSGEKIYSADYYDAEGRVTKNVRSNLLRGYETTSNAYTFTGKLLTMTHIHTGVRNGTTTELAELYTYSYDHADRPEKVTHKLNNGVPHLLVTYVYNKLGQLEARKYHDSGYVASYHYNIRNWLTDISSSSFTQKLYYTDGYNATKCYNGNISSMTWSGSDKVTRGYKFTYDGLNRMLDAVYGEGATIGTNLNRFTEQVTGYDKNGNIKTLQRYGQTGAAAYGLIDKLTITPDGNRLKSVNDAVTTSAYNGGSEFRDGAKLAKEYVYDVNGNLTKDLNKNIDTVRYNCLNLPSIVAFKDGSTIVYTYSADGKKLRTVHKIGATTTETNYCGNVIYEGNEAKQLLTEAGYLSLNDSKYHYYLQDHQGNNRVVINESGKAEETNHYYPFGGVFASTGNVQPYKYNGKELDTKKGLNWYDYGARMYDPVLGRWHVMDPLAERHYGVTPYAYCDNDPIGKIDPTGEDWMQDHYGFYLWDDDATDEETTREGWTYIGATLPKGTDQYRILEEINGTLYHKNTSNPLASLVNWVAGEEVMVEKKAYNPAEDHMMQQFAETGGEFIIGEGAGKAVGKVFGKVFSKAAAPVAKPYTKSNLKMGQKIHKAYHAGENGKEFVLPSGKRIDFLDIDNKIIYELKPYNPRSIKQGQKQLQMYLNELQTMPEYKGWQWKTVLETY